MSKIKANRLEPRATNGSLTIGNPESYTTFEGDVQIPDYATKEYVQKVAIGDVAVELDAYQKKGEKGYANGYVGLDSDASIDMNEKNISNVGSMTIGSIDLSNGGRHINALAGDSGHLSYDDKMKVKWANNLDIYCDTNLQGNKLHSVADPESSYDAVNKRYVDALIKRIEALEEKA